MIAGVVTIMLFNLVDSYFIALLGTAELAAVSFTFPIGMTAMSCSMGLAVAMSVNVSQLLGAGKYELARITTTYGLIFSVLLIVLISSTCLYGLEPLLRLMGASGPTVLLAKDYMSIWLPSVGLLALPMIGNAAIRARGDTKTPAIIMAIAGLVNGVLDPLLIFGLGPFPRLGVQGAALATAISWLCASLAVLWVLFRRERLFTLSWPKRHAIQQVCQSMLKFGFPAALTNMIVPIMNGVITFFCAGISATAVAAFGVGSRLEPLLMVVVMAMSGTVSPIIGQNLGAKQLERVKLVVSVALRFTICWQTCVYLVLLFFSESIARAFSESQDIHELIKQFMVLVPISYGLSGASIIVAASFNALQRPNQALVLVLIRALCLVIPLSFIGSHFYGVMGIFAGISLANMIYGVVGISWAIWAMHRLKC